MYILSMKMIKIIIISLIEINGGIRKCRERLHTNGITISLVCLMTVPCIFGGKRILSIHSLSHFIHSDLYKDYYNWLLLTPTGKLTPLQRCSLEKSYEALLRTRRVFCEPIKTKVCRSDDLRVASLANKEKVWKSSYKGKKFWTYIWLMVHRLENDVGLTLVIWVVSLQNEYFFDRYRKLFTYTLHSISSRKYIGDICKYHAIGPAVLNVWLTLSG